MPRILTPSVASVLCILPLLGPAWPATASTADPAAQALLDEMRLASGGDRWATVRSLHIVGSTASGGMTARTDRWEDVAAGRFRTQEAWPTHATQDGFDGISTWHLGRSGIAYTLGDVNAVLVAADEAFRVSRAWWFSERHAATIASGGTRTDGGQTFDVLTVTPEAGRPFQAWIDHKTHLLARTDEQQAEDRVVTRYSDYRKVNGIMLPFTIRRGDGVDPTYDDVETVQLVETNSVVPDGLYDIPPRPPSDIVLPTGHDSVEVPFRLTADNRILVPLRVDGRRTLQAEFDSGGSLIVQPGVLATLGLTTTGRSKEMGGGEGATSASNGKLAVIALGDAQIRAPAFKSVAFAPEEPDKALVGLEVLQRFVIRFDFDRQVMTLTRPEVFGTSENGTVIPFDFQDNQPEIKGAIDGIAGLFAIDTGDAGSLLLIAPFARRYDLVRRYHANLPYSGKAIAATRGVFARSRVHTVSFCGPDGRTVEEAHDPVTRISLQKSGFDANRNVSANIGLGILKQFNITFDYTRQRVILERNHLFGQKDVFNRAGLRLRRKSDVWIVTTVFDGSPADQAGIRIGDTVSSIDGRGPDKLDAGDLVGLLEAPVGSVLALRVTSGGMGRIANLTLRDIL